jgi:hypothetical protein
MNYEKDDYAPEKSEAVELKRREIHELIRHNREAAGYSSEFVGS